MSSPYEVVPYRPADKRVVAELAMGLWPADLATATRYLEWKYEENPYLPAPLIYLARRAGRPVGLRGFYGASWESGSGDSRVTVTIPVADDLFVSPAERDRGVVTQLMRTALADLAGQGHRRVLNLSGSQLTVLGSLAMGWKSAGPVEPVGLNLNRNVSARLRAALRRVRGGWRVAEGRWLALGAERRPFRALDQARETGIDVAADPRPQAMSDLVRRTAVDGRIRHVTDPRFLDWRFRNPLRSYRFLYAGSDRLDGYLVLAHPLGHRSATVKLTDLEAASPEIRHRLLEVALRTVGPGGLFAWGATLPADTLAWLETLGMVATELAARAHGCPCVLVRSLDPAGPDPLRLGERDLAALADWDLRMLHTMAG